MNQTEAYALFRRLFVRPEWVAAVRVNRGWWATDTHVAANLATLILPRWFAGKLEPGCYELHDAGKPERLSGESLSQGWLDTFIRWTLSQRHDRWQPVTATPWAIHRRRERDQCPGWSVARLLERRDPTGVQAVWVAADLWAAWEELAELEGITLVAEQAAGDAHTPIRLGGQRHGEAVLLGYLMPQRIELPAVPASLCQQGRES